MADASNVIDLMFGRIDRNTDTRYRDRALAQNQTQFDSNLNLDQQRVLLEQAKLNAAKEQFFKNFGLQQGQFDAQQKQQGFANNMVVNESVAKGLFRPIDGPVQQGVKPDNIFMRNPTAIPSVDPGDPTMGSGFEFNGQRLQPVDQKKAAFADLIQQKTIERRFKNEDIKDLMDTYTKQLGVDPWTAMTLVHNPQLLAHVIGSNNIVGFLSLASKGMVPESVITKVIKNMGSQTATQAEAGETDSMRAMRMANVTQSNAQAGLATAQAKALNISKEGEGIYNQAATAVFNRGINASDPRYIGAVRSYIDSLPIDQSLKNEAASVITKDTQPRTLGQSFLSQFTQGQQQDGKNPQTPSVPIQQVQPTVTVNSSDSTSRPSGSAPAVVNIKPPSFTGPYGSNVNGPLGFTQPDRSPLPPMEFIPNNINEVGPSSLLPSSPQDLLQYHPLAYPVNKFSNMMQRWKQRQDERKYN